MYFSHLKELEKVRDDTHRNEGGVRNERKKGRK
jgi:hypothetical protein